jgi:hypothetical protein
MPEMIAGMCLAIVALGTICSSFGLQWPKLSRRLYWIAGLITSLWINKNRNRYVSNYHKQGVSSYE